MAYTYDIATSKKDNRSTVCLSVCHLLFSIISLFTSTFLVAHIYTLTDNIYSYAINVAVYNISSYAVMLVAYYLFSFWVDKTNRIWVYRVGTLLNTALVVVAIFFGKDLAKIIVLAGALNGLSHGAYYASYNVLKQEMVSRKSMNNFAVVLTVLSKVINCVCPIVLGILIDVSTFSMVAIYVLAISVILIFISFFIKAKRPENSNFNIRQYFKRLKQNEDLNKKVKSIYIMCFLYGFVTVTTALLNINIMVQFGSSFSLGIITSIFALVSIVVLLILNKFSKQGKRSWLFVLCSILPVISASLFAIMPNIVTLIIYNLFIAITETISGTIFDIYRNKNLKEAGFYQDIAEHQCVVESIFQVARILSFGMLALISLFKNNIVFQVAFVVFVSVYCLLSVFLMRYEKDNKQVEVDKVQETENKE